MQGWSEIHILAQGRRKMNKANLNNLLSLLCMEEAGTESKEQDEYEPYYSHKKLTIIRY